MSVLVSGLTALALGFAAHILFWKVSLPRHQTRVLFALLAGASVVTMLIRPLAAPEIVYFLALVGAVSVAYVIFYTTVEGSSPSLDILMILDRSRTGVSQEEMLRRLDDQILVLDRLEDLLRCGMVVYRQERYRIAPSGAVFVWVFIGFRKLLRAGKGG